MNSICRLCLTVTEQYFNISETDNSNISISSVLKTIIPELCQEISNNPVICKNCHRLLYQAYNFRLECMKTENLIATFLHITRCTGTTVCLRDVIDWCKNGIFGTIQNFMSNRRSSLEPTQNNAIESITNNSPNTSITSLSNDTSHNIETSLSLPSPPPPPALVESIQNEQISDKKNVENTQKTAILVSKSTEQIQDKTEKNILSEVATIDVNAENKQKNEKPITATETEIIQPEKCDESNDPLIDEEMPLIYRLEKIKPSNQSQIATKSEQKKVKSRNSKSTKITQKTDIKQGEIDTKQEPIKNETVKSKSRQSKLQKKSLDVATGEIPSVIAEKSETVAQLEEATQIARPKRQRKNPTNFKQEQLEEMEVKRKKKGKQSTNKKELSNTTDTVQNMNTIDEVIEEVIEGIRNVSTIQIDETAIENKSNKLIEVNEIIDLQKPTKVYVRKKNCMNEDVDNSTIDAEIVEIDEDEEMEINKSVEMPKNVKIVRKRCMDPGLVLGKTPVPCKCRKIERTTTNNSSNSSSNNQEKIIRMGVFSPSVQHNKQVVKAARKVVLRKHYTVEKKDSGASIAVPATHPIIKVRSVATMQATNPSTLTQDVDSCAAVGKDSNPKWHKISDVSSAPTTTTTSTTTTATVVHTVPDPIDSSVTRTDANDSSGTVSADEACQQATSQKQNLNELSTPSPLPLSPPPPPPPLPLPPLAPLSQSSVSNPDEDSKETVQSMLLKPNEIKSPTGKEKMTYSFVDLSERIDFLEFQSPINLNEIVVNETNSESPSRAIETRKNKNFLQITSVNENQFDTPEYIVINKMNKQPNTNLSDTSSQSKPTSGTDAAVQENNSNVAKTSTENNKETQKNESVVFKEPVRPEPPRERRRKPRPIVQQVINGFFTNTGDYINDHDYFASPYIQNKVYRRRERKCIYICFLCNFIHYEQDHLTHMTRHSTTCQVCNIKFANAFTLNIHTQIYHYHCRKCDGHIPFREPHRCQQPLIKVPKSTNSKTLSSSTTPANKLLASVPSISAEKQAASLRRSPRLAKKPNTDKPEERLQLSAPHLTNAEEESKNMVANHNDQPKIKLGTVQEINEKTNEQMDSGDNNQTKKLKTKIQQKEKENDKNTKTTTINDMKMETETAKESKNAQKNEKLTADGMLKHLDLQLKLKTSFEQSKLNIGGASDSDGGGGGTEKQRNIPENQISDIRHSNNKSEELLNAVN